MVNAVSTTKGRKLVDKQIVYFVFLIKTWNLLASQQNDPERLSILQFRFYLFSLVRFFFIIIFKNLVFNCDFKFLDWSATYGMWNCVIPLWIQPRWKFQDVV
jgi:hypothetical protein